jgi:hypothetical protein
MSYTLIERKELTSAASSISFENIPQFYTDLIALVSGRTSIGGQADGMSIIFNGNSSNYSSRRLYVYNSSVASDNNVGQFILNGDTSTANTFSNVSVYIPNYSGSTNKSFSVDGVAETNATNGFIGIGAGLWSNTAPITSVSFSSENGTNLLAGSSVSLYGINRQQVIGAPKAVGGVISSANGYWVHTFTGSGTFLARQSLDVQALVVAGGGGGGRAHGAGGGAGGYTTASLTVAPLIDYAITIGAGGAGQVNGQISPVGFNSTFANITSIGGGGGGGYNETASPSGTLNGRNGGSGGGAWGVSTVGLGTSGQGNNGGIGGTGGNYNEPTGGGGGAGGVGGSSSGSGDSSFSGNGGVGLENSITGTPIFYAGGGGGAYGSNGRTTATSGGAGGGGAGGTKLSINGGNGVANTGGGAGGGSYTGPAFGTIGVGGNGGSGVVIIRYKA